MIKNDVFKNDVAYCRVVSDIDESILVSITLLPSVSLDCLSKFCNFCCEGFSCCLDGCVLVVVNNVTITNWIAFFVNIFDSTSIDFSIDCATISIIIIPIQIAVSSLKFSLLLVQLFDVSVVVFICIDINTIERRINSHNIMPYIVILERLIQSSNCVFDTFLILKFRVCIETKTFTIFLFLIKLCILCINESLDTSLLVVAICIEVSRLNLYAILIVVRQ